jgi:hypothetical protein
MAIQALIPYALAAYGGYQGYKSAKDSGASGIGRLLGAAGGAYGGYTLGNMIPGVQAAPFTSLFSTAKPVADMSMSQYGMSAAEIAKQEAAKKVVEEQGKRSIMEKLLMKKATPTEYDPIKVSALAAGIPYALGAFDQGPTDIYSPGYNVAYADFAAQRPGFSYIDPQTGQEKQYEKVYIPEADPNNQGAFRSGPYSMTQTRLKEGGLAQIKKFNEGGINYLPSKVSHDEDDSNNYVRAHGYVEDGSGAGDKDEDTMLAQLADGEFVTRADGVLGAGIIAGANPNSIKDMREKGAQYFYNQQARYKRVFDLLKEKNGNSKQKTN